MSNIYGKGARGTATKLQSAIIRTWGKCESCGSTIAIQCAHIIGRKYNRTRTDLNNAFCLCGHCHAIFTDFPMRFAAFVKQTIGTAKFRSLEQAALRYAANPFPKIDWKYRVEFLKDILTKIESGSITLIEARKLDSKYWS